jgi:hypothetical protein
MRIGIQYIVNFGKTDKGNSSSTLFEDDRYSVLDLRGYEQIYRTDGILSEYIAASYKDLVSLPSISIKRNVIVDNKDTVLLGSRAGWIYNDISKRYMTTVEISSLEGRTIDFGPYPIYINGAQQKGKVTLPYGETKVEVVETMWIAVDECATESALKTADPLYPYNHKLLIEGYTYPGTYSGKKIYHGVDSYYGVKMNYLSEDLFDCIDKKDERYYSSFTIVEINNKQYFKVKVDKEDATWTNEKFDCSWIAQDESFTDIYFSALLVSTEMKVSPKIESFTIRVI